VGVGVSAFMVGEAAVDGDGSEAPKTVVNTVRAVSM
jgi:hypothetical protein